MVSKNNGPRTIKTEVWFVVFVAIMVMAVEVAGLNGPNVCIVQQKYNITKRVKYRAPMSVRTYEWCLSIPPRCSKWNTEMRDLTRLETEERTAKVTVCCPGYKMRDVSCVPICPNGKTGPGCSQDCPPEKWGPNCVHDCEECPEQEYCSAITGECECQDGWQGESCEIRMPSTTVESTTEQEILTTATTKNTTIPITTPSIATTLRTNVEKSTSIITSPSTIITKLPKIIKSVTSEITTQKAIQEIPLSPVAIMNIRESVSEKPSSTTETLIPPPIYNSSTHSTKAMNNFKPTEVEIEKKYTISMYNRTDTPIEISSSSTTASPKTTSEIKLIQTITTKLITAAVTTEAPITSPIVKETAKETKKADTTTRILTTMKFKPKEIWIKPAQKGESVVETKIKSHELHHIENHSKHRGVTNKESLPATTTPKTIIVSIIPTSVSYATFRKIALTTISLMSQKTNATIKALNKTTEQSFTRPMSVQTTTSTHSTTLSTPILKNFTSATTKLFLANVTITTPSTTQITNKSTTSKAIQSSTNGTNSMTTYANNSKKNSFVFLTTVSSTNAKSTQRQNVTLKNTITTRSFKEFVTQTPTVKVTNHSMTKFITAKHINTTTTPVTKAIKVTKEHDREKISRTNATKTLTKNKSITNVVTTDDPSEDEETFHILTEPEHITAVMGEKGTERSSVDLISVISIAGGVMMAVITVAVIIVMVERCKKPRYQDVRKINDIHMQVMIDNNDVPPPPYVRSIFHTPLPDPPNVEKCHYQPISTLDRNLKQFMRPVVVQTISPIMLENFRGILECHYDHLPRRSHDFSTMQTRSCTTPSMDRCHELRHLRASVTESTIEALKCEAKLDVIDNTTSEPLYAEIPCWRPPSEHAIEIMNLNGEAVTEL